MTFRLKFLPLAMSSLLAACASAPSPRATSPSQRSEPAPSAAAPAALPSIAPPATATATPPNNNDDNVWARLRDSFAMGNCDSDPAVTRWAKHFTRHPQRFESQLQAVLPRLVFVQKVASRYDVPGEFALLPWVESHFQPVSGKRHRPVGMWQIMPATAGAMGLRVDGHYDGRMDIPAATTAVMKLLAQYYEQFNDWRVADYAYNAGEFSIRRIIRKYGIPPAQPTIPHWPVRKVTRNHLTKLLGIACVVREPSRFHVTLPSLPEAQRLVKVDIPHSMSMVRAADHAGLSTDILKNLNSAFRGRQLDADAASYLMLPASHAEQFKDAVERAKTDTTGNDPAVAQSGDDNPDEQTARGLHRVRPGESLWKIAKNYHVKVAELKRWNHLSGSVLKPGQLLRINTAH